MADCIAKQISDAVAAELAAQATLWLPAVFSPQSQFVPRLDRKSLAGLQVISAPRARRCDVISRQGLKKLDFVIGIGVWQGLAAQADSEFSAPMLLCEQIGEHFPLFEVTADGAKWTCTESQQGDEETSFFDLTQVDELDQFRAVIDLTFEGAR